MSNKLFTPQPRVETREDLHAKLKYESSIWLGHKAVADRSEQLDGEAVHKTGVAMGRVNHLLEKLHVIDMSTIPVMDESPHPELAHTGEPLDGRGTE